MSSGLITLYAGETMLAPDVEQYQTQIEYWMDGNEDLVIDCLDLKQLDGSGLGLLHDCWCKLVLDNRTLKLDNVAGQPASMLKTLGIYELLTGERNV